MTSLRQIAVCVLLIWAVIAAGYQTVGRNGLVWDDAHTLVHNEHYRGLNFDSLKWMFTTTLGGHYQPLTWMSFAADDRIWGGLCPGGIHLTNVLLHTLTACGFFLVCRELLRRSGAAVRHESVGALAATLWWALHPLRVESVAWATERRDVLSGVWLTAAVFLYLRAIPPDGKRGALPLMLSVTCYVGSLLSKAAGITLPLLLLVLDVFPLARLKQPSLSRKNASIAAEKLLFAAPAAIITIVALFAQSQAGALRTLDEHPMSLRLMQACYGIVFYLRKMVWPNDLIPLYEQDPNVTPWAPEYVLSLGVVLGITALSVLLRRKWRGLLATWAVYVILLLPVLGFAQSGPQIVADRYTYLASMPWGVLLGGAFAKLFAMREKPRRARLILCGAGIAIVAVFVLQTRSQVSVWQDEYTLWTTVVERAPATGMAHANLAVELNRCGDYPRAIEHAARALDRLPGNRTAHLALGSAALATGDFSVAARHLAVAVQIAENIGKTDSSAMLRLAAAHAGLGDRARARELYQRVLGVEPHVAEWEFQFGSFLASIDQLDEAAEHLSRALSLDATQPAFHLRFAIVQKRLGRVGAAIDTLTSGLAADPRSVDLRTELAWILATTSMEQLRDGARALDLAQGAVADAAGGSARAKEALAAAHAEMGNFSTAADIVQAELEGARHAPAARRDRLEEALIRYRQNQPFRE